MDDTHPNVPAVARNELERCAGTTKDGARCRLKARADTRLCSKHDPGRQETRKGGRPIKHNALGLNERTLLNPLELDTAWQKLMGEIREGTLKLDIEWARLLLDNLKHAKASIRTETNQEPPDVPPAHSATIEY